MRSACRVVDFSDTALTLRKQPLTAQLQSERQPVGKVLCLHGGLRQYNLADNPNGPKSARIEGRLLQGSLAMADVVRDSALTILGA